MDVSTLRILFGFYVGTVLINIGVGLIQYLNDRKRIQLLVLLYWMGILVATMANLFATNLAPLMTVLISSTGSLTGQTILAYYLSEIRGFPLKFKPLLGFFALGCLLTVTLYVFNIPFQYYALPAVFGAVFPVFYAALLAWRTKTKPFTQVQKMFLYVSIVMSIHYLDWPFFKEKSHLYFFGSIAAFAILYVQSILIPMLVNEKVLQDRNEKLEEEIHQRASELTDVQRQLWESNKLASIGRMAGGIAHEINNPLTIINMYAENIHEGVKQLKLPTPDISEASNKIQEAVSRIAKITDGLRKVAKDHRSLERTENDLNQIIEETLAICRDRMKMQNILFQSDLPQGPLSVICNSAEISQIILNLLNNAIDAVSSAPQKEIFLSVIQSSNFYELRVQDSGKIDPGIASRIMDPFFSNKPRGEGTGLGLSVGRAIAENHGGQLYLDSKSTHTRFVLQLPKLRSEKISDSTGVFYDV